MNKAKLDDIRDGSYIEWLQLTDEEWGELLDLAEEGLIYRAHVDNNIPARRPDRTRPINRLSNREITDIIEYERAFMGTPGYRATTNYLLAVEVHNLKDAISAALTDAQTMKERMINESPHLEAIIHNLKASLYGVSIP